MTERQRPRQQQRHRTIQANGRRNPHISTAQISADTRGASGCVGDDIGGSSLGGTAGLGTLRFGTWRSGNVVLAEESLRLGFNRGSAAMSGHTSCRSSAGFRSMRMLTGVIGYLAAALRPALSCRLSFCTSSRFAKVGSAVSAALNSAAACDGSFIAA
jgi:hypothetical protein